MRSLACASLSGRSPGQLQPGEGGWSPPLPPTQGDSPDGFDGRRDTPHFVLLRRQGETTRDEIDAAEAHAESLFAKLSGELGPAEDAAQQARDYREQTPAKHIYMCQAGKDS